MASAARIGHLHGSLTLTQRPEYCRLHTSQSHIGCRQPLWFQLRRQRQCTTRAVEGAAWSTWAVMSGCAAGGQVLQDATALGRYVSAPLFALILGFAMSTVHILPTDSSAYDTVWAWLMPLATALYLLDSADLRQIVKEAGVTLVAFGIASAGTIIGTLISWFFLSSQLGQGGWKVAAALCGSYIGGSMNFAAISLALVLPAGPLMAAAMAADIFAMAAYLVICSIIPAPGAQQRAQAGLVVNGAHLHDTASVHLPHDKHALEKQEVQASPGRVEIATAQSMALALAAATASCALGEEAARVFGGPSASLAFVSVFATIFASGAAALVKAVRPKSPAASSPFLGASALGGALMLAFFVTIGAAAGSITALLQTGWLAAFIALQLGVHMAITLGIGRLLNFPMEATLTASNAAVGGPSTALAMASGRGWTHMMRPAILTGSLGYAIGNGIGCAVGQIMHVWPTLAA